VIDRAVIGVQHFFPYWPVDGQVVFDPEGILSTWPSCFNMLLGALPDLSMSGRQRIPVKGEIPNPINPPPGCTFNPRCPLAFDLCRQQSPELIGGVACHAVNQPASVAVPA